MFLSIPKIIQQRKNVNDDKESNQTSLFERSEASENNFDLLQSKPWKQKELLYEEFKSLGFYISDHPLNEYRDIFNQKFPTFDNVIPYFWMPKFIDATDASARTLGVYKDKQKSVFRK